MQHVLTDYTRSDWTLITQEKLIQNVNGNLATEIIMIEGQKVLKVSNVREEDLDSIYCITNTDKNNNYLYLDDFTVYVDNYPQSIYVPGLKEIVINSFRASDSNAFINGKNTHTPFSIKNFVNTTFTGTSFNEFIDDYSGIIPFAPSTKGSVKTYEIIFNPDSNGVKPVNPKQVKVNIKK
jgi:hypothetical protein